MREVYIKASDDVIEKIISIVRNAPIEDIEIADLDPYYEEKE